MDLWFSEVHTPDVKLSLRTAKQLYAGKSEWQDIEVLDTPAFGKILILNGHVLYFQMQMTLSTTNDSSRSHGCPPKSQESLGYWGWRRRCCSSINPLS